MQMTGAFWWFGLLYSFSSVFSLQSKILLLSIAFLEHAFDTTTFVLVMVWLWTKTLKVLFGMVWVWHDNYHDIYEICMIWRPREECGIQKRNDSLLRKMLRFCQIGEAPWLKFVVFGAMDIRSDDQIFRQAWERRDGPFDQQQLSGYVRRMWMFDSRAFQCFNHIHYSLDSFPDLSVFCCCFSPFLGI